MVAWLQNNVATLIISAVIIVIVCAVILGMVKNKKKGRTSCGCGCAGCAMNGACHGNDNDKKK